MDLRRDMLLPVVVLLVLVVLVGFGAVTLLARMAPAIERIITENVDSLEAAEELLALFAGRGDPRGETGRFEAALARLTANITESEEAVQIELVRQQGPAGLKGDATARQAAVAALRRLAEINREAILRTDRQAKRLGYAGAWAAVLLTTVAFAWGLVALRRMGRRLVDPLTELATVVRAAADKDAHRRCRPMAAAPELQLLMAGVDELLDDRARARRARPATPADPAVRAIISDLLDDFEEPAIVVDDDGRVEAANAAGLRALQADDEGALRAALTAAVGGEASAALTVDRLERAERWLCLGSDEASHRPPQGR